MGHEAINFDLDLAELDDSSAHFPKDWIVKLSSIDGFAASSSRRVLVLFSYLYPVISTHSTWVTIGVTCEAVEKERLEHMA